MVQIFDPSLVNTSICPNRRSPNGKPGLFLVEHCSNRNDVSLFFFVSHKFAVCRDKQSRWNVTQPMGGRIQLELLVVHAAVDEKEGKRNAGCSESLLSKSALTIRCNDR